MYDTPHSLGAASGRTTWQPEEVEHAPTDSFANALTQASPEAMRTVEERLPTEGDLSVGALATAPAADVVLRDSGGQYPDSHHNAPAAEGSDNEPRTGRGMDMPPPIDPPNDGTGTAGGFPERPRATPTLEPGQVKTLPYEGLDPYPRVQMQDGAIVRQVGGNLEDYDPEAPAVYADEQDPGLHVPTDTALIARQEPGADLVLHTRAHGGEVVTMYNPETGEGAVVRVGSSHEGATLENFVEHVADAVSALGAPGTGVTIVGDLEQRVTDEGGSPSPGTGLAEYLRTLRGIEHVNLVHDPGHDATVTLDISTGLATITTSDQTYRFEPPVVSEAVQSEVPTPETSSSAEAFVPNSVVDIIRHNNLWTDAAEAVAQATLTEITPRLDALATNDETPETKAEALNRLLPPGDRGLNTLIYMILRQHPVLDQLRVEHEGDMHIADVMAECVFRAYEQLEEQLDSPDVTTPGSATPQLLAAQLETLDAVIAQISQLQATREGLWVERNVDPG